MEELKVNLGGNPITFDNLKGLSALPERLVQAMAASEKKHDVYLFERDWGEFDAAGREPVGLDDPAVFFPALCVRSQKVGWDDALVEYAGIMNALGKDNVLRAIQQVHAAPKVHFGVLRVTAPEPVMTTPSGAKVPDSSVPAPEGVIGVTGSAIRAVEGLATQGDDRRYLLWLLTSENRPGWGSKIDQPTKWQYAETTYRRFVIAFGEPDVLQAARLVRTATKRATIGGVMDPAAIGATRGDPFPAFADIVTRKVPPTATAAVAPVPGRMAYDAAPSIPLQSGDETLEINGKSTATRWQSQTYAFSASSRDKECSLIVKVWTSDAVPSGLVRKTVDRTCPETLTHGGSRLIEETFLESLEEGKSGAQGAGASRPAMATDVPPSGPPIPGARPVDAAGRPVAEAAPSNPATARTSVPAATVRASRDAPPAGAPTASGQVTLAHRYGTVVARASRDRLLLPQLERKQAAQGIQLPADVRDARDSLETQLKAVVAAMQKRDDDQLDQSLKAMEAGLSVIEKYVKQ